MKLRYAIAVVVFALVAASCGSSADNAASPAQDTPSEQETATTTTTTEAPADEPDESAIEADQVEQEPAETATSSSTTTEPPVAERPVFGPVSLEPACSGLPDVSVGLATNSLTSGGNEYEYQLRVPSAYDGSPVPVVLDFHGIGSNGGQQAVFSGWAETGELQGFLSVQPTGLLDPTGRPSWELPQFEDPARDDIAFTVDLIDDLASRICIDPARIYATGMSNGGLFTSTLVCELSERIAAAVSVAGVTHHESCSPTRAVPYLAFHGTADTVVPFNGGGESTLDDSEDAGDFFEQVIPDEFAEFADSSGCTESTDLEVTAEITLTSYTGCTDDVPLGFYTIEGGGHTWPGSAISAAIPSLGFTNTDISATEIAWEFFNQYTLAGQVQVDAGQ